MTETGVTSSKMVLSICIAGRDDDYMPDFRYRITTTLNHYASTLTALARLDQVELVVVDWGSRTPLSACLELSDQARRLCRFLYASKAVLRRTQEDENLFHSTRSCNVALRRARGRYLFLTNADQLMPQHSMDSLLRLLTGALTAPLAIENALMIVPRVQVPWQFAASRPSVEDWDRYIALNEYALAREPSPPQSYVFGSTAGFVFSNSMCQELGGLNEVQAGWGWSDIEFCIRATMRRSYLYLSSFGVEMFHMGHAPSGGRSTRPISSQLRWSTEIRPNAEGWGLANEPVEEQRAERRSIEVQRNPPKSGGLGADNRLQELTSTLTTDHVRTVMIRMHGGNWNSFGIRIGALCFLSWYCTHRYIRRYLEIGRLLSSGYGVVVCANPSVEIIAMEALQGDVADFTLPTFLRSITDQGYCGHLQIANSKPQSRFRHDDCFCRGEGERSTLFTCTLSASTICGKRTCEYLSHAFPLRVLSLLVVLTVRSSNAS